MSLPSSPQQMFVRREVWELEAAGTFNPTLLAYAKAVRAMQEDRPTSHPTSWAYQAGIHGSYETPPKGATWNACKHRSWFFFPWHRMYLYYFERIVRKLVLEDGGPSDFALPYWDYDRASGDRLPSAFRTEVLPDGTRNPLFVSPPHRSAILMDGKPISDPKLTSPADAMKNTDFSLPWPLPCFGGGPEDPTRFGGAVGLLESTPHNVMHPTIGGGRPSGECDGPLMSDPGCAALDPIFWLHHANIDRLWNIWLALGGGRKNPTDAQWLKRGFSFHDETGAQVSLTVADVVDSAVQLGYVYDDAGVTTAAVAVSVNMPEEDPTSRTSPEPPELAAATEEPLVLTGVEASVSLTMPDSLQSLVEHAAVDEARRFIVTVEDIEAEQDPGLVYAVYLRGLSGEQQHVGNVSFFGIQEMNDPEEQHDDAPGFRYTFDATEAVSSLRELGSFDPRSITVTFEPITLESRKGAGLASDVEETEVLPVSIGRVSFFVT